MSMKKAFFALSVIFVISGCAVTEAQTTVRHHNAGVQHFYNAPVVSSSPIVQEFMIERQECRTEVVQRSEPGIAGAIIGGAIGAALGNQVGGGSGKQIATATGAVAGAAIGNREQNAPREVEVCEPYFETHERIVGYRVTYLIGGKEFTDTLARDPGRTVRVQMSVR